jgi:glycosyltransferase involved in cell wall biosynthesis
MTRKACLIGPAYPYRGGIAHSTSLLAKEFSKDHDVLVVNFKRLYPSFLFPGKTQFDESKDPLSFASDRIIDSLDPTSFWRAARRVARFEPDIVVFQWWHPFFAVAYASIVFSVKRLRPTTAPRIVYVCHNVMPHESSPVDRLFIRLGFGQVRSFLVQSREDRSRLVDMRKDARVQVNPLPSFGFFNRGNYTRARAREELGVDGRVVLFFGYVRPYKGLGVLIEAFADVLHRMDAVLYVVGEIYEGRERYLERIRDLGMAGRVHVVDRYVADEEVEKYFAACDVVVLPYLSATQSAVVQIAYGFNKPVIVTSVGGLPDVVDDGSTGFVVPPNDPGSIARAIEGFFESGVSKAMEHRIASSRDRFSWERCKRSLIDLVEDPSHAGR